MPSIQVLNKIAELYLRQQTIQEVPLVYLSNPISPTIQKSRISAVHKNNYVLFDLNTSYDPEHQKWLFDNRNPLGKG